MSIKREVKAKIKISPVVVFGVLSRMVLVRESWDAPFLLESQSNSRTSTETGWLRPTRWGFVCKKMSLKAPFRSYKSTDDRDWPICCTLLDAESTGFGPKRLRCSVPPLFPIEHGWTSGHVLLGAQITWSPRQQATTFTPRFNSSSTRVTGLHPKKVKQASKLYPAGTVTRWLVYAGARDRLFNHVRLGIKEERCIAAFSDQNQSTQRPNDYNIWANRGHSCFDKNEMALLVTFCIQIPI